MFNETLGTNKQFSHKSILLNASKARGRPTRIIEHVNVKISIGNLKKNAGVNYLS